MFVSEVNTLFGRSVCILSSRKSQNYITHLENVILHVPCLQWNPVLITMGVLTYSRIRLNENIRKAAMSPMHLHLPKTSSPRSKNRNMLPISPTKSPIIEKFSPKSNISTKTSRQQFCRANAAPLRSRCILYRFTSRSGLS